MAVSRYTCQLQTPIKTLAPLYSIRFGINTHNRTLRIPHAALHEKLDSSRHGRYLMPGRKMSSSSFAPAVVPRFVHLQLHCVYSRCARSCHNSAGLHYQGGQGPLLMEPKRCACGIELQEWRNEGKLVWAASIADMTAYLRGQFPRHDILNAHGRRIRIGQCEGKTPYGLPIV